MTIATEALLESKQRVVRVIGRELLAKVREKSTDFSHYKEFVPHKFQNARVIAKENGNTDLYMQVPVMRGMVTLWQVLRRMRERGETIVLITHKLDEVMSISDMITVMRHGRTISRLRTEFA